MANFISFLLILLLFAAGFLSIYLVIDFFEYLKRFQASVWKDLCFERPFGIPRDDFFFYPVRPLKFMGFLFDLIFSYILLRFRFIFPLSNFDKSRSWFISINSLLEFLCIME